MKQTIIISGGLGNQMFQYAFFLSMKAKGKNCRIDDTLFYTAKMHNGFELKKVFSIPEVFTVPSLFKKAWLKFLRKFKPSLILCTDKVYQFSPYVYKSKKPYLMGDWLSPHYFNDIEEIIRKTYRFVSISSQNLRTSTCMQACNSVSVHIRRGDYLNLPNYCVCDEMYYHKAIQYVMKKVDNPVFYVFSNDPSWGKSFMKQFDVRFIIVDWNQGQESYQDMFLMTQSKHNIIANSTFSWWGAWLNQNINKIVVAPKYWFRNNNYNINCQGWHLI